MNLDLDPTQTLLRETTREYLASTVPFDRVRACEREERWDSELWRGLIEQGWLGLPFPESIGGGGGRLTDAGLLLEEFARRAAVVPLAEALVCGLACTRSGSPSQASAALEGLLSGDVVPVPAVLEESDTWGVVEARVEGEQLIGEKLFVDYGQFASHHLVAARENDELGLYRVDARDDAVGSAPLRTIGRTPSARVVYRDAAVEPVGGPEALRDLILTARAFAAVQCLGPAQEALDQTVAYAKVREQFGRPIGTFQAVQHHAANMASRVASTRYLVYEALHALDHGAATPQQVAFAKASASRMVPEVTMLAHQIHGGNGMIEENDLYFFTLRGKDRSLAWGSAEECLEEASAAVDAPREWIC
jgi:alkylation response protein AidB-like acyl-CoA dehydrogenase